MKTSEALRLRGIIEGAMDVGVDDATALEAVRLFPVWGPTAIYEADKLVWYEGVLYRCLQSHTARAGWDPVCAPSLWAMVIPGGNTISAWEQPDSTNPYAKGDKVTHSGKTWVSLGDENVWEPGGYGWEEIGS